MGNSVSSQSQRVTSYKQAQREQDLLSAKTYDSSVHDQYLKATSQEITSKIQKGEWTASKVLEAYIARASHAQSATNCLTEILFARARKQARLLDAEFEATGKLKGPLHGVPISFKDQFNFAGVDSSLGFSQWVGRKATADADVPTQFIAAGAIPFVKTNVPQTVFAFECSNPVFGRTTNPYNSAYTCGGSSGGEGALLALDGSVIGVGTDVGGSLRIPATYNGIYSLKPGSGRVSMGGTRSPTPGFEAIQTVAGPMARSVDDLEIAARIMFGAKSEDPRVAPVPFREPSLPPKLRFGYFTSDDFIKASPACKRAVHETVDALRAQGHHCIEVKLPTEMAVEAFKVLIALASGDGYKTLISHIPPDPQEEFLFMLTLLPKLPSFVRSFVCWMIGSVLGDELFARVGRVSHAKPMEDHMKYIEQRDELYRTFKKEVWEKHQLDGMIVPVQALPQLPHNGFKMLSGLCEATALFNVLDIPAGVVPVTHVDPALDKLTEEWKNAPGCGSKMLENELYHSNQPVYDPVKMKGMPVGVQVVGWRWEDEKVLRMMKVVDQALGPRSFGPGALL